MGKKLKKLFKGTQGLYLDKEIVAVIELPEASDNENIIIVTKCDKGIYYSTTLTSKEVEDDIRIIGKPNKVKVVKLKTRTIQDGLKSGDFIQNVNQISDKRKVLEVFGNVVFVSDKENYHLLGTTRTLQELINDKYILVTN